MAAFDASGISVAALAFRGFLAGKLSLDPADPAIILIGPLAEAFPQDKPSKAADLNLFFFHIEPGGYPSDDLPREPQFIRLYCLITSLAQEVKTGADQYSAGEGDLRLIGNVMRHLHENPVLKVPNPDSIAELQIVLSSLSAEDMGHIWASQREASHRLSVVYELALVPVPMSERAQEPSARVLETEVKVLSENTPPLTGNWMPEISFVDNGALVSAIMSNSGAPPGTVKVVGAPRPSWNGSVRDNPGEIELLWEAWDRAGGWRPVNAPSTKRLPLQRPPLAPIAATDVDVPPITAEDRQLLLYGVRQWRYKREDGSQVVERIRSNSLLLSWHPAGVP